MELDGATRTQWLRARQQGIGGSDVGGIMGVSPFVGPFDVYASKVEPIEDGDDDRDMNGAPLMRLGQLLEDGIAVAYGEKYGATITKPTHLYAHDVDDWRLANPDRFIHRAADGDGLLEVKQGHSAAKYEDGLPDYISLQAHHYLGVVETAAYCDVAVLMFGRDLVRYRVERDDELLAGLRSIEEEFWEDVVARRPPVPDHLAGDTLKRLYRNPTAGAVVDLDDTFVDTVREFNAAKAEEKAAKAEVARLGNMIRAAIGDAETGAIGGVPAADWKRIAPEEVNLDKLEADNPGLLDLYREPNPQRRLTIRKAFK
jgi:putative phage-type endonuclease